MDTLVSIERCETYDPAEIKSCLIRTLEPLGGLSWVHAGMRIAVKANLVSPQVPDSAATVHPALVTVLCELLIERGASVIVGDSPGGLYTPAYLKAVYARTGMNQVTSVGAELNYDCSQLTAHYPEGTAAKNFEYTAWLHGVDAVVDVCKLKTHGFLTMTGAVKNLFGIIPGTKKPEYHYLYPDTQRFADMLVDLCEFIKPRLSIMDAVVGMEGNGPTSGTPRKMGAMLASFSPYALDLAAGRLIGVDETPLFDAAFKRGLAPCDVSGIQVTHPLEEWQVSDWDVVPVRKMELIATRSPLVNRVAKKFLNRRPELKPDLCVSCGLCARTCPVKAITLSPKPVFDRSVCIRCFCCQEFCPKSAIIVKRGLIARLLVK